MQRPATSIMNESQEETRWGKKLLRPCLPIPCMAIPMAVCLGSHLQPSPPQYSGTCLPAFRLLRLLHYLLSTWLVLLGRTVRPLAPDTSVRATYISDRRCVVRYLPVCLRAYTYCRCPST
ncbi:hypothetical protein IF2G_04245 [Cordyceps javanica]|nr:hypothetical protein IF2G_04245 [Cordyceps javanica]